MVEGRQRDDWDRLSSLLALIHNVNATEKTVHPDEMNPFLAGTYRADRPKTKDVGFLARMCGVKDLPPDAGLLPKPRKKLRKKVEE